MQWRLLRSGVKMEKVSLITINKEFLSLQNFTGDLGINCTSWLGYKRPAFIILVCEATRLGLDYLVYSGFLFIISDQWKCSWLTLECT